METDKLGGARGATSGLPTIIRFEVLGMPAPQGSKKAFVNKFTGKAQMKEQSDRVAPWRQDVKAAAYAECVRLGLPGPLDGALRIQIDFRFPRPKSHFGTGRNATVLKPSAPIWVTEGGKGDVDKLLRSTFDALTYSGMIADDRMAARVVGEKRYCMDGELPGATVTVRMLPNRVSDLAVREPERLAS